MKSLQKLHSDDLARLLLRIAVGGLMLFHGVAKVRGGIGGIEQLLQAHKLPAMFAYGVYVGEVLAPLLILLGFYTRPAALIVAFNMLVAVGLAHRGDLFKLDSHGAWALELHAFYLLGSLALFFTGSGKFGLARGRRPWD